MLQYFLCLQVIIKLPKAWFFFLNIAHNMEKKKKKIKTEEEGFSLNRLKNMKWMNEMERTLLIPERKFKMFTITQKVVNPNL